MILGLHLGPHDSSAAIIKEGVVLAMMEQERFDHKKHSGAFPSEAISFCLAHTGVQLKEVAAVAYASDVEITNYYKRAFIQAAYQGAFHPTLYEQSDLEKTLRSRLLFDRRRLLTSIITSGMPLRSFLPRPSRRARSSLSMASAIGLRRRWQWGAAIPSRRSSASVIPTRSDCSMGQ